MTRDARIALVGPCPPPHGGISVHVATLYRQLTEAGVRCRLVDSGGHRRAAGENGSGGTNGHGSRFGLLSRLSALAGHGWALHLHTNGHNRGSWLLALSCGLAARQAPARVLTLHSGMLPAYLASGETGARALARVALGSYDHVYCVSEALREALVALGADPAKLEVAPASLPLARREVALPEDWAAWIGRHRPLLSSALFFRPEYGFDLLADLVERLRARLPELGCVVMGDGEGSTEAREAVRARGLADAFLFTGDVEHDLCLAVMARSDVYLRPARADGDALSVREALALGVPVVASDAAHRPPGTVRFASGDAAAFADTVEAVLCLPELPVTGTGAEPAAAFLDGLIDTYGALCAAKETPWAPRSWAS